MYFLINSILPSSCANSKQLSNPILTENTVECFKLAPHQNEVMYLYIKYYDPEPAVLRKEVSSFITSSQRCLDKLYSHSFLDINR